MSANITSKIIATGSFLPKNIVPNSLFLEQKFFEKTGVQIDKENEEIISKFKDITEIEERRYADKEHTTSDLGYFAAEDALESSGIDPESLDYIIVAHNFGDIKHGTTRVNAIPTIAARIKHRLKIKNADCVAYDLPFGCPGWLQGMIQANYFIKSGDAKRIMIIGSELLSRLNDPFDRDSMIFADGSGATILEASDEPDTGIVSHKTQSHTENEAYYLYSGTSSNPEYTGEDFFIKMEGRKIYEYALTNVPLVIKTAIEKAGLDVNDISKVLVHQANGKMDEAILKRLFKLYSISTPPAGIMPMTISKFGNSSVATIPTMLDLMLKNKLEGQTIKQGDAVVMASVGAGMNINALVYRF